MIYTHQLNGIQLCTGDVICTTDGIPGSLYGEFWLQVGRILPGDIDHCALYVGPGGRCVEAEPAGVIVYEMPGDRWDAEPLANQRHFVDRLYGVAYPVADRGLSPEAEKQVREAVANYCLKQATLERPYNLNFVNSETEEAFYCSQLIYKAYLSQGIDLRNRSQASREGLLARIVLPEEIWHSSPHCSPSS